MRRVLIWVVAAVTGSLAGRGVVTLVTGGGVAVLIVLVVSLFVAAFVIACVVTALTSLFASTHRHWPLTPGPTTGRLTT
jgi:uncharacterized membrane protein